MFLGPNIRYLRKKFNLSQEELAEKFGYKSYTTIQKWESNRAEPPAGVLKKMAEIFHVTMDDMYNSDLTDTASQVHHINIEKITKEGTDTVPDDIKLIARSLEEIPQESRDKVLRFINNTIDTFIVAEKADPEDHGDL